MSDQRQRFLGLCVLAALAGSWFLDPSAIQLRLRYPHAKITDCHEYRWILPAFLHSRWAPANDLNFGRYLEVELSDQSTPVDFSGFAKFPVFLVTLNRCKVDNIQPLLVLPQRVSVVFNDCDLTALPAWQLQKLEPLPEANRFSLYGP